MRTCPCGTKLSGKQTKFCSRHCKDIDSNSKHQSYDMQQKRGKERKLLLIKQKGGCCQMCGYSKNLAALCFHHTRDKLFTVCSRNLSNRSWKSCLSEADKCILLCHNCHAELHNPGLFFNSH